MQLLQANFNLEGLSAPNAHVAIRKMKRPAILHGDSPLPWSTGTGNQVWNMLSSCQAGNLRAIVELLSENPELVRCQHNYRSPLYFAVLENQIDVAKLLLERGANPFDIHTDDSMLEVASMRGYGEMERLLRNSLLHQFNASENGEPLAQAIREGDLSRVKKVLGESPELLAAGDQRSNQPIHWATMTRHLPILEELLDRGANIDAQRCDGARPIQLTNGDYHFRSWSDATHGQTVEPSEALEYLRSRGAFVDIATAASIGDLPRVKELLQADESLANSVSEYLTYYPCSGSPLRNAAGAGHVEIVNILLEAGADPNLREEGIAPRGHALYSAVAAGHHTIAEILLQRGAFPNPEVESSGDALSRAIANKDKKMQDLLCSYGAAQNVDILAYYGDVQTAAAVFAADPQKASDPQALVNAAGQGHAAFVKLLLRYQPDLPLRGQLEQPLLSSTKHSSCMVLIQANQIGSRSLPSIGSQSPVTRPRREYSWSMAQTSMRAKRSIGLDRWHGRQNSASCQWLSCSWTTVRLSVHPTTNVGKRRLLGRNDAGTGRSLSSLAPLRTLSGLVAIGPTRHYWSLTEQVVNTS